MHRKLIYSLISVSVLLLFLNIAAEIFIKNSNSESGKVETAFSLEKKFLAVINSFSIKPEWILKSSVSKDNGKVIYYKILIPESIKTPILINEIASSLESSSTLIEAKELSIGGNVDLMIYNDSRLKLKVKLVYDKKIERDISRLALIMLCDGLTKDEIEEIKSMIPVYHLLIPLNDDANKLSAAANSMGMEYSVLLNDDISSEYELDESESKKMILSQLAKIFENFPSAVSYIVDQNSSIYTSKIFPLIKSEFQSKEKMLFLERSFHSLVEKNYDEQVSLFQYYCTKYVNQDIQNIIIRGNDLGSLQNEIYKAQLKGNQFVRPEFNFH